MMFPELHPKSKVWVYTSNRLLNDEDKAVIAKAMGNFLPQWAAHGDSLFGDYSVLHDRFLILVVDESQASASGCSIDTSVRFIKDLGAQLNVDFFNRMNLVVDEADTLNLVHVSEVKNHPQAHVFNPMITNLTELRDQWRVPVSESPFV